MKSVFFPRLILAAAILALFGFNLSAADGDTDSPREKLLLDFNWKFHLGDDWPNMMRLDKAGQISALRPSVSTTRAGAR